LSACRARRVIVAATLAAGLIVGTFSVAAAAMPKSSAGPSARRAHLVVCSDPNNLPFSNRERQGFENKIIELVAEDLDAGVTYLWWPQRRGFIRKTLNASKCDVWPGIATGVDMAATTHPYYRSNYVFVTRASANLEHLTLDDPRLKRARIGVQMIGNDAMNTPPAHAIASRGITGNVRGYMIYGDYGRPNPPAAIVDAVGERQIDIALVWGPVAGYFAHRSRVPLRLDAVTPASDPRWPMSFDISMGVRRGDRELLDRINATLERDRPAIEAILERYHVPLEHVNATAAAVDAPARGE
jgi:mxaJ protein